MERLGQDVYHLSDQHDAGSHPALAIFIIQMQINNREEFIKYFDELLIENGIREICKHCNNGEFIDSFHRVGCCFDCEQLGKDGCLHRNTSCVIASCPIIRNFNSRFHYYLEVIRLNRKFKIKSREDADIRFPLIIPKFNSSINWMKKYNWMVEKYYPYV